MEQDIVCDVLIIGSGAAGLYCAANLPDEMDVVVVNKGRFEESSTWLAQGGIAAPIARGDSIEDHVRDTLAAGCGLCHEDVVRRIIEQGVRIIEDLRSLGADFDTEGEELHLTREGGHSRRRIAHARDATGRAIDEALHRRIHEAGIRHLEHHTAIDLVTSDRVPNWRGKRRCLGAYLLDPDGRVRAVRARHTVLATGGAGKAYLFTSNSHAASGDGIAMAWRAGVPVMNLEFIQFHPTCLYHPQGSNMLLSEALRGEGAIVVDGNGRRFLFDYDERGELAPRDIVARAIDHEMKRQGVDCMYLDARPIGRERIDRQFPNIRDRLADLGIDILSEPIPIVPAAHYLVGGIQAGVDGRTALDGLYAIGETACTGLHGANRLASNSLLECLAMARLCAAAIRQEPPADADVSLPAWDETGIEPEAERISIKQNWDEIRATMSNYVGIVRSNERLRRAHRRLTVINEEVAAYYWRHPVSRDLIELRNLALVADLIIRCALARHESRGLHYSIDYPFTLDEAKDTILNPEAFL